MFEVHVASYDMWLWRHHSHLLTEENMLKSNWYLFAYSRFAYSCFAYFRPKVVFCLLVNQITFGHPSDMSVPRSCSSWVYLPVQVNWYSRSRQQLSCSLYCQKLEHAYFSNLVAKMRLPLLHVPYAYSVEHTLVFNISLVLTNDSLTLLRKFWSVGWGKTTLYVRMQRMLKNLPRLLLIMGTNCGGVTTPTFNNGDKLWRGDYTYF